MTTVHRTPADARWSLVLAGLCMAGAATLAWTPTAVLLARIAVPVFTVGKHVEQWFTHDAVPFAPWTRVIWLLMLLPLYAISVRTEIRAETRVPRPRPTSPS